MQSIIGREAELAALEAFFGGGGAARVLVLEGEAGAGKTTLFLAGVEAARERGFTVLEARPAEAERSLALTGVSDLLEPVLEQVLPRLSGPQQHALRVAMLLAEPGDEPPDRRAVAVAVFGALRSLVQAKPLLVAIDDVQWLDADSADALAFSVRRLSADRVAFLMTKRSGEGNTDPLALSRAPTEGAVKIVHVRGLSLGALHALLRERVGAVFTRPTLRAIRELSGGNPFFALELARAVERRGGRLQPSGRLDVPERLQDLVRDRLEELPSETLEALATAAALSQPTADLVGGRNALDPALAANVVEIDAGRIRFTHPLLASAAYAAVDDELRKAIHRKLAGTIVDVEERARHLAAAASAPDTGVALTLDEAARRAHDRGATAVAADFSEQALSLTPVDDASGGERQITAARYRFEAGDGQRARELLEGVLGKLDPGSERARVVARLARVRSYDDDLRTGVELFEQALAEAHGDVSVEAEAHEGVAGNLFRLRERLPEAVDHARAAARLANELGYADVVGEAVGVQLLAEAAQGRPEARQTLQIVLSKQSQTDRARVLGQPKLHAAVCWMWWDDLVLAASAFSELLERAAETGDEASRPYVLVLLGQCELVGGDLKASAARADEGLELAEQAGQESVAAYLLALRGLVGAHSGQPGAADDAERALAIAARTSGRPAENLARWALGVAGLTAGRPGAAVEALLPAAEHARREGIAEPGAMRFVPDAVEALAAAGRRAEARNLLDWYESSAARLGRSSALAAAVRSRALLAEGDAELELAFAPLAEALESADWLPLDRARAQLALGGLRRRARLKAGSRQAIEEAIALFDALGAAAWSSLARDELARIGGRGPATNELTPAEERVATLVGEGLSNKEVAARLFISVKTVEGHLSRIYTKLGIRSRAALARRVTARS